MAPLLLHTHPQTDTRTGYTQAVAAFKEERKGGKGAGLSLYSPTLLFVVILFFCHLSIAQITRLNSTQRNNQFIIIPCYYSILS